MPNEEIKHAVEQHDEELRRLREEVSQLKDSIRDVIRLCQTIQHVGFAIQDTPEGRAREAFGPILQKLEQQYGIPPAKS